MAMRAGEKRRKAMTLPMNVARATMKMMPYTIMKADEESVEVDLYGEVVEDVPIDWWTGEKVEGLFIELKQFLNDLDTLKDAKNITFRINSIGGDVEAGISIYNRIRGLAGKTTTVVDGLAASAASIIAQAGDVRQVSVGAQTMIHGASAGLVGYYNLGDVKRIENMLTAINKSVAGIYAERSGADVDHIRAMMEKEKWMTPEEAVAEGFADEIVGKEEPVVDRVSGNAGMILVNGVPHTLRGMPIPDAMKVRNILPEEAVGTAKDLQGEEQAEKVSNGLEPSDIELSTAAEGRKTMDLQELQQNHPDLVEQIRNEAAQTALQEKDSAVQAALEADRKRMMEIDSISQMVGDPALVNKAKYEEPIDAKELAFKAMQAQQAAGNQYLANREEEAAADVTGSPNGGMEDNVAENEAELNGLINKLKEGK